MFTRITVLHGKGPKILGQMKMSSSQAFYYARDRTFFSVHLPSASNSSCGIIGCFPNLYRSDFQDFLFRIDANLLLNLSFLLP